MSKTWRKKKGSRHDKSQIDALSIKQRNAGLRRTGRNNNLVLKKRLWEKENVTQYKGICCEKFLSFI